MDSSRDLIELENKIKREKSKGDLYSMSDMVDEWGRSIINDIDNPLTFGFPSIDIATKQRYRGTVMYAVGLPGSKKSIIVAYACSKNVVQNKHETNFLYSNMEMGVYQTVSRFLATAKQPKIISGSQIMNTQQYYEAAIEISYKAKKEEEIARVIQEVKDIFQRMYGDKLKMSLEAQMTIERYDQLCERLEKEFGKLDGLIVDGLSMTGGSDDLKKRTDENTRGLKELAKKFNMFVMAIAHCARVVGTRAIKPTTRDTLHYAMGGQAIQGNGDHFLMLSFIKAIDENESDPSKRIKQDIYRTDKGYARYWGKRTNGKIIDKIFNFDVRDWSITESEEDPESYNKEDGGLFGTKNKS